MKWPIKNPVAGEKRTRRKFALLEAVTAIDKDGKPVKLLFEWYEVTEVFVKYQKEIVQEWATIERRVIGK